MKKLSKEAAFNLKAGFGSLISNRSAIEAGKAFPWWSALIIALISAFLPIIPIMTGILNTNGESFISGTYNYSFDRNGAITAVQLKNANIGLTVDEQGYLTYSENGAEVALTEPKQLTVYTNTASNQYEVQSYFLVETEGKSITDHYNDIVNRQYKIGTTELKAEGDPSDTKYYTPTTIFFYKDGMAIYLAKNNTTTAATKFSGNYLKVTAGELVSRIATVEGKTTPTALNDIDQIYTAGVYSNFKSLLNESYQEVKEKSLLYTSTIYYAIYFGLILLLGLLIFILTRGKKNFNNYLKWYQCLCISGWSSFTPGVLSLILGFIMNSYAVMFFILFMGVRIMWLSMKQLSPTYQGN